MVEGGKKTTDHSASQAGSRITEHGQSIKNRDHHRSQRLGREEREQEVHGRPKNIWTPEEEEQQQTSQIGTGPPSSSDDSDSDISSQQPPIAATAK
jgi:hypothetical protein